MNTPNPFSDHTHIPYIRSTSGALTTLCINDVLGNVMETVVNEKQKTSAYTINPQAGLQSEVYSCNLISDNRFRVIKIDLRKVTEKSNITM